jgi:hypothetical protein
MTVTFGAGVLPHLDDLFDTLASKIIEVVIGIVSAVGQHPGDPVWQQAGRLFPRAGRKEASQALSSLTNRPTIDPEVTSTHMQLLIIPSAYFKKQTTAWIWMMVGLPEFESGSQAPKARRMDQATPQTQGEPLKCGTHQYSLSSILGQRIKDWHRSRHVSNSNIHLR